MSANGKTCDRKQADASRERLLESLSVTNEQILEFKGLRVVVNVGVFSPLHFNGWRLFTDRFPDVVDEHVLEIGCGTGVTALHLAKNCGAAQVLAVDIDPAAVENTRTNAELNDVDNIEVRCSDIYSGLLENERFYTIYWNLPFIYMPDDYQYQSMSERGLFDPGYRQTERFLAQAHKHLEDQGHLIVGLADFADLDRFKALALNHGYSMELLASEASEEINAVEFQLYRLNPRGSVFYAMQFTGKTHSEIVSFREKLHGLAQDNELHLLEQFIGVEEEQLYESHGYLPLYIAGKDHGLLERASIVLVDFSGYSIGRDCELVVSNEVMNKRVIAIVPEEHMRNHPYIRLYSTYIVDSPDAAFEFARRLLAFPLSGNINALSRQQKDVTDSRIDELLQHGGRDTVIELMPTEMKARWRLLFADDYSDIMEWSLKKQTTKYVRLNRDLLSESDFEQLCETNSWTHEAIQGMTGVFRLKRDMESIPFGRVQELDEGAFYIQDLVSQLAPMVLGPQPGESILDLGAAPGSKTSQMALMMHNLGEILAIDNSKDRLEVLHHIIRQQGISIVKSRHADATIGDPAMYEKFDRVLVDAPCSCEGIIRYRYHKFFEWGLLNTYYLVRIQQKMLMNGFAALKPGGTLVYSTCTYAPEENEEVVNAILKHHPNAELNQISLPESIKRRPGLTEWQHDVYDARLSRSVRFYPQDNDTIGFFLAKIVKRNEFL